MKEEVKNCFGFYFTLYNTDKYLLKYLEISYIYPNNFQQLKDSINEIERAGGGG
jgi:hypothetical protein